MAQNNNLEKQLEDLQISGVGYLSSKVKSSPPPVPPKKKATPQVPQSAVINSIREPSYSSRISPVLSQNKNNNQAQSKGYLQPKLYANVSNFTSPVHNLPGHLTNSNHSTYTHIESPNKKNEVLPAAPVYRPQINLNACNHNVEEYLPAPPSPVSSNYSELARATSNMNPTGYHLYQNEYPLYAASQASTYESLYEPINPRPNSSQSARSLNSGNNNLRNDMNASKSSVSKEQEVDSLTNLLVKSISNSQDLDVLGICIRCNENIFGETSGCTAMGFMYHVECFCCYVCNSNLKGKPFYAVEGHPYCETDYLETLEKCSVCNHPILDRILRATGKPYHPVCFTCVVCGKSLDGIPFTVDAMNQIHCIDDFHKKFAPRCCVCQFPIMPEDGEEETVRVVALDRSFHVKCYRCEDCGLQLRSEAEGRGCYPLDNHILCKTCNAHRIRLLTNVMTTDL